MDINSWEDTWGTIDWENDPEDGIKKKIIEFYRAGVDFNMEDEYGGNVSMPLDFAAKYSSVDVVELLIDGGADINLTDRHGRTSLHWAGSEGKAENLKYLIDRGPSDIKHFLDKQDKDGWSALMHASGGNNEESVSVLIAVGADVNAQNNKGETALHLGILNGNIEIIKLLIKAGADVRIQNCNKETAIHKATEENYPKIVKELIKGGIGLDVQNKIGWTALMYAAKYNCVEIAKVLIEAGADVNIQDNDSWTALHSAALNGNTEIAKALIEYGANTKIKNYEGKTALDVARDPLIPSLISNAKIIRAAYLAQHPVSSLRKTLDNASVNRKSGKNTVVRKGKTR